MLSGFQRYLAAKKSVDDRALNRPVWEALRSRVAGRRSSEPLRILELGCGIGTMVERLLEWGLSDQAHYLGIDEQPDNITAAWQRLPVWAGQRGFSAISATDGLALKSGKSHWQASFAVADALDFCCRPEQAAGYDLVIAHAFLDLIDIPQFLPWLAQLLAPGGLFYFTLNFDGETIFEPVLDAGFEARVMALYHRSMDERLIAGQVSGDSRAGRHLFGHLRAGGARLLAAGASDWVVYPHGDGYPDDEAYFLNFILGFFADTLAGHPELKPGELAGWLQQRRQQIAQAELVYIAHQLDFLGEFSQRGI
ncbi:MAG: class I SAM-dependent methyltransferase [Anaerolineales bacterium]|nr:class I SAM-dependent methyltransferase [Anaerolineales bacterium]